MRIYTSRWPVQGGPHDITIHTLNTFKFPFLYIHLHSPAKYCIQISLPTSPFSSQVVPSYIFYLASYFFHYGSQENKRKAKGGNEENCK